MRIIAGDARGRRILAPDSYNIRPTSDRVKESLFNMIGSKVENAQILDLFGGTGNLGLESISRGALFCIFVDSSRESIKLIRQNIKLLGYDKYSQVYNNDAQAALRILNKREMKFDVVFMDPPYKKNIIPTLLTETEKILNKDGILVVEHDIRDIIPERVGNIINYRKKNYGDTVISLYKISEE